MTCTRCEKDISFNQWLSKKCYVLGVVIPWVHHTVMPGESAIENILRNAYAQMLTEAAYARSQP